MKKRLALAVATIFVASTGLGFGATAYRVFYPRQGDRVIVDDLDLTCSESHALLTSKVNLPQMFACGDTASGDGPYVRITPIRITIAGTNQRLLFSVKRDR
jgi:hypothetical protein